MGEIELLTSKISMLPMLTIKENGRFLNPLESLFLPHYVCMCMQRQKIWHF